MSPTGKEKYFHKNVQHKSISSNLDEIETILGKLDGSQSPIAERIFDIMDEIQEQKKFLHNDEKEKTETQLSYVTKRIYSSAKVLLKTIGGKDELKEKRKIKGKNPDHWWWYLDHYLEEKKKRDLQRSGMIGLVLLVVFALLVLVYDRYLAPPPEVRARIDYETRIDDFIYSGDYISAMSEMEGALAIAPDYYPLWIKKGVLAKVLGNEAVEQSSYETAQQFVENPEYFYYERASVFMQFGLYDDVLEDTDNLLAINAKSAEAYLYRGLVYEMRGENSQAYDAFEKAALLAEEQNKNQLVATIRVRMGMLLQSVSIPTQEY
jgi:tetratricopeptide (TPR) repeat protein